VFQVILDLEAAPGSGTARTTKVTVQHLKKFYKNVQKLACKGDDPTFLEARADAWDWFCDLLHRHYRGCGSSWYGDATHFGAAFLYPYGIYRDGRRSADLQGWLDADRLDLTTPVLNAMAYHALAQILGGLVEAGDEKGYGEMAARFALLAESQVASITAEIDTDGDGTNDLTITLGVADTLEG